MGYKRTYMTHEMCEELKTRAENRNMNMMDLIHELVVRYLACDGSRPEVDSYFGKTYPGCPKVYIRDDTAMILKAIASWKGCSQQDLIGAAYFLKYGN